MDDSNKIITLKKYYEEHNQPVQKFNIIGIRNEADMDKDSINDVLGFFTDTELFLTAGTTDPGVYWTKSAERNPKGTFHLMPGFHDSIWTFGIHKGYDALVNDWRHCRPTKGWRDSDYNFIRDPKDIVVCDYFGVNFHRMSDTFLSKIVGKWSAGCQVIQSINDFLYIYKAAQESGEQLFSYMLFMQEDYVKLMSA